ncbi:hemolysin family protein [Pelagicoccus sp. SDUM812002]|uniref:hemolysin family protein n=1 Tax=Pelagicoccus sp. SDUM812002 TaxID=3041266 RepID=UPI00280F061C|nr:hemolysin family protein [Pelagicoccus sp. SDUM812002]MDQ8186570.1 hemolysin family protein [Pelagicoccus sp. SDUM812002]
MIALFAYLLLSLGVSFLCSILEAALLSMPPSFVRQAEKSGARYGKRLSLLKRDIDQSLAAILTLNTIAHTVGAAGVGSQAVAVFGEAYFGIISAILTLLILIFSEIIPKTLGAQNWRSLAPLTTYTCHAIVIGTYPIVALSKQITALLRSRGEPHASVSRDEIVSIAQIGKSEGVLAERESQMIRSLIRFRDLRVENIMTPRTVLGSLSEDSSCSEVVTQPDIMRFTRIPVYSDNKDNITGYVIKTDLLQSVANEKPKATVGELKRPIRLVSEYDTLAKLFDELLRSHEQIAIVVDEYGGTSGLVTMEDLIETLIGLEIVDESDSEVDMRLLARERWEKRARAMGTLTDEPDA